MKKKNKKKRGVPWGEPTEGWVIYKKNRRHVVQKPPRHRKEP